VRLIYIAELVDRYEIGRNAKLLETLQSKNLDTAINQESSYSLTASAAAPCYVALRLASQYDRFRPEADGPPNAG